MTTTGCKHFLNDPTVITSKINNPALTCLYSLRTSASPCSLRISHSFRLGQVPMDSGSLWSTNGLWRYCQRMLPHRRLDHCIIQGKTDLLVYDKQSLPKEAPQSSGWTTYSARLFLICSFHYPQKNELLGQMQNEPHLTRYIPISEITFYIKCHSTTLSSNK